MEQNPSREANSHSTSQSSELLYNWQSVSSSWRWAPLRLLIRF